jgi:hypothetical protein
MVKRKTARNKKHFNASYHKYGVFRDYLSDQNKELREKDWTITCVNFALYAPRGAAPPPLLSI